MSEADVRMIVVGTGDLLDFERAHRRHTAAKEQAIIKQLGISPSRYYQLLSRAAASLEGQAHDPLTARRVRSKVEQL